MRTGNLIIVCILFLFMATAGRAGEHKYIRINRKLDVIKVKKGPNPYRRMYAQAGRRLGPWKLHLAGLKIDGPRLVELAEKAPDEPFLRVLREGLRRPVDMDDMLYFLDDVLLAGRKGLRQKLVWVPSGRARAAGILIHPDDVFEDDKPRLWAERRRRLAIDRPRRQIDLEPAEDGDLLGPNWTVRYKNPFGERARLAALEKVSPSPTFTKRVESLMQQLRQQGSEVHLWTTVRNRHRGYLMWGCFMLSRRRSERSVTRAVRLLEKLNHEWGLDVPIRWYHPGGWRKTVEAARKMADTYDVVFATRSGARNSRHYEGEAVDMSAVGMPRKVKLVAPDGAEKTFDLSHPEQTRDLSLTPELIDWVEEHFLFQKLRKDYAHWNDTAPADRGKK